MSWEITELKMVDLIQSWCNTHLAHWAMSFNDQVTNFTQNFQVLINSKLILFFKSKQTNIVNIGLFLTFIGFPRIEDGNNLFVGIEIHGIHLNGKRCRWDCLLLKSMIFFVFRFYDFFFHVCHIHSFILVPLLTT